jgi:hypothetical protein
MPPRDRFHALDHLVVIGKDLSNLIPERAEPGRPTVIA